MPPLFFKDESPPLCTALSVLLMPIAAILQSRKTCDSVTKRCFSETIRWEANLEGWSTSVEQEKEGDGTQGAKQTRPAVKLAVVGSEERTNALRDASLATLFNCNLAFGRVKINTSVYPSLVSRFHSGLFQATPAPTNRQLNHHPRHRILDSANRGQSCRPRHLRPTQRKDQGPSEGPRSHFSL